MQAFAHVVNGVAVEVVEAEIADADGKQLPGVICRDRVQPAEGYTSEADVNSWELAAAVIKPLYPSTMDWRACDTDVKANWVVKGDGFSAPQPPPPDIAPPDPIEQLRTLLALNPKLIDDLTKRATTL